MNSRRKKALHGFAGAGIFQPPAAAGLGFKMQRFRQRFSGQRGLEIKPAKARRPWPVPAETHLPLRKPDQPVGGGGLGKKDCHRRFVKLNQAASGIITGEHEVAAEFGQTALRPPERLALLDMPPGTGSCEQTLLGSLTPAEKQEAGQKHPRERMAKQPANG